MKCLKTFYVMPRRRKVIKTIYDLVHSRKVAKAIYDLAPLVLIGWITSYKALPTREQISAVIGMYIFSRVVLEEVVALVKH